MGQIDEPDQRYREQVGIDAAPEVFLRNRRDVRELGPCKSIFSVI